MIMRRMMVMMMMTMGYGVGFSRTIKICPREETKCLLGEKGSLELGQL